MIEHKTEVKTYMVRAICNVNGCDGELKPTGEAFMCNPPKYVHVCEKCKYDTSFNDRYPKVVVEPV